MSKEKMHLLDARVSIAITDLMIHIVHVSDEDVRAAVERERQESTGHTSVHTGQNSQWNTGAEAAPIYCV
jgi:hypothetical protein